MAADNIAGTTASDLMAEASIPEGVAAGLSNPDTATTLERLPEEVMESTEPFQKPTDNQNLYSIMVDASNKDDKNENKASDGGKGEKDEEKNQEQWEEDQHKRPLKAEVTWCDFERFKNRYGDEEGLSIIEVLKGHAVIHQEVQRETDVRTTKQSRNERGRRRIRPLSTSEDTGWIQRIRIQSPVLLRLMSRLSGHADHWPSETPRVFFQPFRSFHHYLPQMKECMQIIEARLVEAEAQLPKKADRAADRPAASVAPSTAAADMDDLSDDGSDIGMFETKPLDPCDALSGDLYDQVALSHIKKYVEFADEYLEPRWKAAAGKSKRKFRFHELSMVFQEGNLLYLPPVSSDSSDVDAGIGMMQRTWRLAGVTPQDVSDKTPNDTTPPRESSRGPADLRFQPMPVDDRYLSIYAYYIDWDGTSFVPVEHEFEISIYGGERDITSFQVYPMRYAKDAEKILAFHQQQGAWFREVIPVKHLYFEGWSFTHGPRGNTKQRAQRLVGGIPVFEKTPRSEHIEGEVMIDFAEGFKSEPSVGAAPPAEGITGQPHNGWPHGTDQLTIRHWQWPSTSDEIGRQQRKQLKLVGETTERLQVGEIFNFEWKSNIMKKRPVCKAHEDGAPLRVMDESDEDTVLLPSRVVAYSFRERQFFMLPVMNLRCIPSVESDPFRDLKISIDHKFMVQSLVQKHFEKQVDQKSQPAINFGQDIIRGKGSGLSILLHGVPGVGKTATAEAVAQSNNKPLFVITCGDLGFTPKEVETALRDIFRLAHKWDCILLLDEADVFLSRREIGDLKRNALVSVFLRVLEYYSGILFLTTNRVGTLDEAFKSRIHISLYYPPLSLEQTLAIYRVNIRKLHEIEAKKQKIHSEPHQGSSSGPQPLAINETSIMRFAELHFKSKVHQCWNGRQIRNAFQIAHSLAYFKSQDEYDRNKEEDETSPRALPAEDQEARPAPQRELNATQFKKVAVSIVNFERYLESATGGTDKDRAQRDLTRDDGFDQHHSSGRDTGYRNPQQQQQRRPYQPPQSPYEYEHDLDWSPRQSGGNSARGPFSHEPMSQQGRRLNQTQSGGDPQTPHGRSPRMAQDQLRDGRGQRQQGGRNTGESYLSPMSQDGSWEQQRRPTTSRRGRGDQDRRVSEDELELKEDDGLDDILLDDYYSSQRRPGRDGGQL